MPKAQQGVAAVVLGCVIWGFAPIYYKTMAQVPPLEMLSHRGLWTLALFAAILWGQGRLAEVGALLRGPQAGRVVLAGGIIALNWGIFIWAIQAGHAVESSLGYYILPLVSVVMGVALLGERLAGLQGLAVMLAAAAVGVLTWGLGVAPWIALALAFSFAPYLLIKKAMQASALVSVTAEVLVIAPFALALLVAVHWGGWQEFGRSGGFFGRDLYNSLMLPVTGLISGIPLMLFSWGAQRVRLSTLGLVQYLNPSLQAFSAVVIMAEPFTRWHGVAFAMIWAALAVYSAAGLRQDRAARRAVVAASTDGTAMK